jgi:hypothetical protein
MENTKECMQVRDRFLDLNTSGRGLDPDPTAKTHVAECKECEKVWSALSQTYGLLDEWRTPEASPYWMTRFQVRLEELRTSEAAEAGTVFGRIRATLLNGKFLGLPAWQPAMAGVLAVAMSVGISLYQLPIALPTVGQSQSASAVHDLNKLEQNQDVYASMDVLDDLPSNTPAPPPASSLTEDGAQKDSSRM